MPDATGLERRARAAVKDAVAIGAADRREPGAPIAASYGGLQYDDRMRLHVEIQCVGDRARRHDRREVDVRDLTRRMDAGIGAPGGHGRDRRTVRRGGSRRLRAPPGPPRRWPGAASRRTRHRRIRSAAHSAASAEAGAGRDRPAAQELVGRPSRRGPAPARAATAARLRRCRPAGDRRALRQALRPRRPALPPIPSAPVRSS